jgi:hypothetical protein
MWNGIKNAFRGGYEIGEEAGELISDGMSKSITSVDELMQGVVAFTRTASVGKAGQDMGAAINAGLLSDLPLFKATGVDIVDKIGRAHV